MSLNSLSLIILIIECILTEYKSSNLKKIRETQIILFRLIEQSGLPIIDKLCIFENN